MTENQEQFVSSLCLVHIKIGMPQSREKINIKLIHQADTLVITQPNEKYETIDM